MTKFKLNIRTSSMTIDIWYGWHLGPVCNQLVYIDVHEQQKIEVFNLKIDIDLVIDGFCRLRGWILLYELGWRLPGRWVSYFELIVIVTPLIHSRCCSISLDRLCYKLVSEGIIKYITVKPLYSRYTNCLSGQWSVVCGLWQSIWLETVEWGRPTIPLHPI